MSLFAFISWAAIVWSFLSMGIEWTRGVGMIESIALAGGQPFYGAGNGTERVIRLVTMDERLIKNKDHGHVGFSIAHSRRTGLSRCGRFGPPKIEINEIGPNSDRRPSMSLVYPHGGPNAIYGVLLNLGTNCSDAASKCASDTSEVPEFNMEISAHRDYLVNLSLPVGFETRSGFKAKSFYALHTPWPAYFSPGGTFFLWGATFAMIVVFKYMALLRWVFLQPHEWLHPPSNAHFSPLCVGRLAGKPGTALALHVACLSPPRAESTLAAGEVHAMSRVEYMLQSKDRSMAHVCRTNHSQVSAYYDLFGGLARLLD
jgi:hypothetical protein